MLNRARINLFVELTKQTYDLHFTTGCRWIGILASIKCKLHKSFCLSTQKSRRACLVLDAYRQPSTTEQGGNIDLTQTVIKR